MVRPIVDIIMSPHYFPISQAQDDLQQCIAATDTLGPIMLHRPESTKERAKPTTLSIIVIEITHFTRFTLLLLLRIQRCMWCNNVTTWAHTDNGGRNLDLNRVRFSYLHYILQYNFWIGFESEKHCKYIETLSVRPHQVSHFVRTFDALLRNNLYRFCIRCASSSNFFACSLQMSDAFYKSSFFLSYSTFLYDGDQMQ